MLGSIAPNQLPQGRTTQQCFESLQYPFKRSVMSKMVCTYINSTNQDLRVQSQVSTKKHLVPGVAHSVG
jgi:hypothetical protein